MFYAGTAIDGPPQAVVSAVTAGAAGKPDPSIVRQGLAICDLRDAYGYTKDEGCPVAVGKGFQSGYHTVKDGWTLRPGSDGPVATLTVVNDNPGAVGSFWHTIHLERYDGSLVEIVWCETGPFAARESKIVTCKPLSPEGNAPYDSVTFHY